MNIYALIAVLLLSSPAALAETNETPASPAELNAALTAAMNDPTIPLSLSTNCTNEQGIRSMEVFDNHVAIWKQTTQIHLETGTRKQLLKAMLDADFANFETHYGGKPNSGRTNAPIIIICAVEVTVAGKQKSSYQDLNGERSQDLLGLATAMLDKVEPLFKKGIAANSLQDGLGKVQTGVLAPETFSLRIMHLPADKSVSGEILKIERGSLSRQSYHPGVNVGEWQTQALDSGDLKTITQLLNDSKVGALPGSLPTNDVWQFTVRVLNHEKTIQARTLNNPAINQRKEEANSFERLAQRLLGINKPAGGT